jgi:hypothetical protein
MMFREIVRFCDIFSISASPSIMAMLPDALELSRICDGSVPNPLHFASFIGAAEAAISVEFGRKMVCRRFRPSDTLRQVRVWASAEFGSVSLRHRGAAVNETLELGAAGFCPRATFQAVRSGWRGVTAWLNPFAEVVESDDAIGPVDEGFVLFDFDVWTMEPPPFADE